MPIRRMVVLAASAILLCATLVSIRGIHYIPADQSPSDDSSHIIDPSIEPGFTRVVELNIEVSLPEDSFEVLEALNDRFMDSNPDIVVQLSNHSGQTLYEDFARAFRLGEVADVMLMDNEMIMQFAMLARLQPADDFYTRSEEETAFLPAVTEQLQWNGYMWGVPFLIHPYILAYNDDEWLGMTGESVPTSIEQVVIAYWNGGLQLEGKLAYAAFASAMDAGWQFPQADMTLTQEEANDQSTEASAPAQEDASNSPLGRPHSVISMELPEEEGERNDEVSWGMLRDGDLAAMIAPLHEYEQRMNDASLAVLPVAGEHPALYVSGQSFVLSAEVADQEAAFRWIRTITDNESQLLMMESKSGYPANLETYEDRSMLRHPLYGVLREAIEKGEALQPDPLVQQKLSIVQEEFSTWLPGEDVPDIMLRIYREFERSGLL